MMFSEWFLNLANANTEVWNNETEFTVQCLAGEIDMNYVRQTYTIGTDVIIYRYKFKRRV